jgi:(S)-citramalyl-CoA lyase
MTAKPTSRLRRSILFVSALESGALVDAMHSGADIVCLDLEDAVPPDRKTEARIAAHVAVQQIPSGEEVEIAVRINSLRSLDGVADLLSCLEQRPRRISALVLPKVDRGDEVHWAGTLADEATSSLDLYAIVETNDGLENCRGIATSHPRLKALFFGGFDLSTALGSEMAWEPLLYARSRVVHAAASAGIDALDSPFPEVNDLTGLRTAAERARSLGMAGKAVKHANHIPTITEIFTPSSSEIDRARAILELFDADPAKPLIFEGRLIELPMIKRLRRTSECAHDRRPVI